MEAIHGVIDDDENDGEEPKVKRSSAQQKIADLMYLEGKSYGEAYDIVVLGKKPQPESLPTPTPPPQPKQQFSVENLRDLAEGINAELENVESEKTNLKQKNAISEGKRQKLMTIAKELVADREKTIEAQKQQIEREKAFNQYVEDYNQKVEEFNNQMKKLKEMAEKENKKTHSYVKKISKAAETEFEEET